MGREGYRNGEEEFNSGNEEGWGEGRGRGKGLRECKGMVIVVVRREGGKEGRKLRENKQRKR